MAEMDTDGGGAVEFDEFLAWFTRMQNSSAPTGWAKQLAVRATRELRTSDVLQNLCSKCEGRGGGTGCRTITICTAICAPECSQTLLSCVAVGRSEGVRNERNAGSRHWS